MKNYSTCTQLSSLTSPTSSISTGLLKMWKRLSVASRLVTSLRKRRSSRRVFSSCSSSRFCSSGESCRGSGSSTRGSTSRSHAEDTHTHTHNLIPLYAQYQRAWHFKNTPQTENFSESHSHNVSILNESECSVSAAPLKCQKTLNLCEESELICLIWIVIVKHK